MANSGAAMIYSSKDVFEDKAEYALPLAAQGGAAAVPRPGYWDDVPEAAPDTAPEVIPEARPREKARPAVRRRYGISLFAAGGFVVVALMLLFVVLAHVQLQAVSYETVQLQQRLEQLGEQERRLRIEYESAFDINEIEEYAVTILGMTVPTQRQVDVVSVKPSDYARIIAQPDETPEGALGIFPFLRSLLEYLR